MSVLWHFGARRHVNQIRLITVVQSQRCTPQFTNQLRPFANTVAVMSQSSGQGETATFKVQRLVRFVFKLTAGRRLENGFQHLVALTFSHCVAGHINNSVEVVLTQLLFNVAHRPTTCFTHIDVSPYDYRHRCAEITCSVLV